MQIDSVRDLNLVDQAFTDTIRIKRMYVDLADDLVAGILLGQIIYWFSPSKKNGRVRARIKKKGYLWIAKQRGDWWDEIRITARQYDRAINKLKNKNFVITKVFRFNNKTTTHIRLNEEVLIDEINDYLAEKDKNLKEKKEKSQEKPAETPDMTEINETVNPDLRNGESRFNESVNPDLRNGESRFNESVNPLTKHTTKHTTKITTILEEEILPIHSDLFDQKLNDIQKQQLKPLINVLGEEVVQLAYRVGTNNNAQKFNWILTTLNDWIDRGLNTVDKVEEILENRKKEKDDQCSHLNKKCYKDDIDCEKKDSCEILEVFKFYEEQFGDFFRYKQLTEKRKRKIGARLDEFEVEDIKNAISAIRHSGWHIGDNPDNRFYAEIEFICRNDEKCENWINEYEMMKKGGLDNGGSRTDSRTGNGRTEKESRSESSRGQKEKFEDDGENIDPEYLEELKNFECDF